MPHTGKGPICAQNISILLKQGNINKKWVPKGANGIHIPWHADQNIKKTWWYSKIQDLKRVWPHEGQINNTFFLFFSCKDIIQTRKKGKMENKGTKL